jgi:hypothetical protein
MSMSQLTVSHVFLLGEFAGLSYSEPSSMSSAEALLAQNDLRTCLSASLARSCCGAERFLIPFVAATVELNPAPEDEVTRV